jgi:hypothetical protein
MLSKKRVVIPAKAGIHFFSSTAPAEGRWIPAFTGMTRPVQILHARPFAVAQLQHLA